MTCEKPPPGWTCSRDERHPGACAARPERPEPATIPVPGVTTLEEAAKWIDRHQRWAVQDAQRMSRIEDRLARLERPWWRRRRR